MNQHAGICGRVPEADTLGRRFTACSCAMPKFFTGDECEMNKPRGGLLDEFGGFCWSCLLRIS